MATILITDDSTFARLALRKIVSKLRPDWTIIEAAGPTEAMAKMKQEHVDVVLIDYHMQDVNGLALAAQLRKTRPDDLSVALVTANRQEKIREKSEDMGICFIGKPVTEEDLASFLDSTPC